MVGLRTITAVLSYMTERPLSKRVPMPMRLWQKVGMMCPWRKGSFVRGMMQDDTDLCWCPVSVPTTIGGTLVLSSPQGESMITYMALDPASAIAALLG